VLNIQSLSVEFSGHFLYENVSLSVGDRDRIGLAGKNGAGKSTLLKLIIDQMRPTQGQIVKPQGYSVGYLAQSIKRLAGRTVYEEAASAFEEVRRLEKEIDELTRDLGLREDYESKSYLQAVEQLGNNQDRLQRMGAGSIEKNVDVVLRGLGFLSEDFERPVEEFSGGWQMRIELAKILLRSPDLILLDEPTNHLDIESIQWLEQFLKSYAGAIIVVSHDAAFLDHVTNRTVEISMGKFHDYKASWTKYLELRAERREKLEAEKKNQDRYIEHTEKLINKFRAKKNKAKFAQGLIKKIDRMERVELDDEDKSRIRFRFPPADRSGRIVVGAKDMDKAYGSHEVLKNIDFEIERGEKIAFVGRNGEGKSTLAKMIMGQQDVSAGELEIGHNVQIGYYAQDQADQLDGNASVFETIDEVATGDMRSQVRNLLGAFLFSGEDVDKKVKVLSGGEKSRLALAKLLLHPSNLLILDEPTNHLDMISKQVLKESLMDFQGTVIVVSHDRKFLKGMSNRVFEFGSKKIQEHIGDIYDYLEKKKLDSLQELERKEKVSNKKPQNKSGSGMSHKDWFEKKKEIEKEEKRLRRQVDKLEKEIEKKESELSQMEVKLRDPEFYKSADPEVFKQYDELKSNLEETMSNWEQQAEQWEILKEEKERIHASRPAE
jgi:ATP-binding cassette subfamily F protein 3